jgi:hypothetical protein
MYIYIYIYIYLFIYLFIDKLPSSSCAVYILDSSTTSWLLIPEYKFHLRCFEVACRIKWFLCLNLRGQPGHWNWGSFPHSSLMCLKRLRLYLYMFPHTVHWKSLEHPGSGVTPESHLSLFILSGNK